MNEITREKMDEAAERTYYVGELTPQGKWCEANGNQAASLIGSLQERLYRDGQKWHQMFCPNGDFVTCMTMDCRRIRNLTRPVPGMA